MMIEGLAAIGLIILYFTWLFSPFIIFACFDDGGDIPYILGKLFVIVYVSGALVVGYALYKFVGI